MTEHKTLNTVIHAAFRRDLARFSRAFQNFPAGSHDRAAELGLAWDNFAFQLHTHHEHEETIFWPAMVEVGVDETLMADLDGEHARMTAALEASTNAVTAFRTDPTSERKQVAEIAIADLGGIVENHLDHEERELEPLTVMHLDSAPMKRASTEVRKASKGFAGDFFAWLDDGADADAKAALRKEIPPPVFFIISRVGGRGYRKNIAPVWA